MTTSRSWGPACCRGFSFTSSWRKGTPRSSYSGADKMNKRKERNLVAESLLKVKLQSLRCHQERVKTGCKDTRIITRRWNAAALNKVLAKIKQRGIKRLRSAIWAGWVLISSEWLGKRTRWTLTSIVGKLRDCANKTGTGTQQVSEPRSRPVPLFSR